MSYSKFILTFLLWLIILNFPLSVSSCPESYLISVHADGEGKAISGTKDHFGPRKKIKKKRSHPLDRKMKMKNGKRCPSM